MAQLQHVDVADGNGLLKRLAGYAIMQVDLAGSRQLGRGQLRLDVALGCAIEYRSGEMNTELCSGPAKMGFENLADIHTRRHTERIEDDFDRLAIGKIWHIFFRHNAR